MSNSLPKKEIEVFKRLYKKRFDKDLSDEEATYRANNLIELYKAIYLENSNYMKGGDDNNGN